jgi:hypothetical protein
MRRYFWVRRLQTIVRFARADGLVDRRAHLSRVAGGLEALHDTETASDFYDPAADFYDPAAPWLAGHLRRIGGSERLLPMGR